MPLRAGERWAPLLRIPLRIAMAYLIVGALWILLSDKALLLIAGTPERANEWQSYKGWFYVLMTAIALYAYAQLMVRSVVGAERKARMAELDFRQLIETTGEGVWVTDAAGRTMFANPRIAELTGLSMEAIYERGLADVLDHTPTPQPPMPDFLLPGFSSAAAMGQMDELKLIRADGTVRFVLVSETPMTAEDGLPKGTLRVLHDNTIRRGMTDALTAALGMQKNLMSELDHRVRNNLASLVAIVQIAASGRTDVPAFASIVVERVRAMATAYSLLAECRWSQIPMGSLVAAVTGDAEERRVLTGPTGPADAMVSADQIVPLTLLLHELVCNARDHGALRPPDGKGPAMGRLEIAWRRETAAGKPAMVVLDWVERGGPPVAGTPEFGFGLMMAKGLAGSDLQGRIDMQFPSEGLRLRLEFPERPPGVQLLEIPEVKTATAAKDRGGSAIGRRFGRGLLGEGEWGRRGWGVSGGWCGWVSCALGCERPAAALRKVRFRCGRAGG